MNQETKKIVHFQVPEDFHRRHYSEESVESVRKMIETLKKTLSGYTVLFTPFIMQSDNSYNITLDSDENIEKLVKLLINEEE